MRSPIKSTICLIAATLALAAQDESMARRAWVTYLTQKNSLPLSEGQRQEADRLQAEATREAAAGRYGDALRLLYQGMALMRNMPWTPASEMAAALQAKLEHAVVDPGGRLSLTLSPLYSSERIAMLKLGASVWLVPAERGSASPQRLGDELTIDAGKLPFTTRLALPETASGKFMLEVRLAAPAGNAAPAARTAFTKSVPLRIEPLAADLRRLRERLVSKRDADPTAAYALDLYARADRGETGSQKFDLKAEFAAAHAVLDATEAGRNPFAARRGDLRRAFRSTSDQTLQPYRVFLPDSYDTARPAPLVIALHGMGGDEDSMFDAYAGKLKPEAQRVGFIVAAPKGRDPASRYLGPAGQDVIDTIEDVCRTWNVDRHRIYLMGHSMGGYGTWTIAADHPDRFAALGPFAGGGNPASVAKLAGIPMYVVHGDNDRTVPVTQSRNMVEAARQAGANVVYVEVKGGSHGDVVAPQFGPMFDFFARQNRK